MSGWDEIIAFGTRLESVGANAKVVQDFTLDDPLTGTVEVLKPDLGKVNVSTVRSTGHRMVSLEPDRITYFSPLAGQFRLTIINATYNVDNCSGLFVRPG